MTTPKLMFVTLLAAAGCGGADSPDGVPTGQAAPIGVQKTHYDDGFDPTKLDLTTTIDTMSGLDGTYIRVPYTAPQDEILDATFEPIEAKASEGTFTRVRADLCFYAGCNVDVGDYSATPQNPAIGYAFISFTVRELTGDVSHDSYIVDALSRDKQGGITVLKLRKVDGNNLGVPFYVKRVP